MSEFCGNFILRIFITMYSSIGNLNTCYGRCHICKKINDTVSILKAINALEWQYIQAEPRDVFKAVCEMCKSSTNTANDDK